MWPKFVQHLLTVDELPTTLPDLATEHKARQGSCISRRHARACFSVLALLSFVCLLWSSNSRLNWARPILPLLGADPVESPGEEGAGTDNNLPPLYEEWYEYERGMPQHNVSLSFPEGANGAYFYPANHVWGLGFNNALQELLFLSHLAYIANRSFVFDPYTWEPDRSKPYADYNGKLIPSRIPLNALISGPTAGGSFGPGDKAPRSVIKEYWEKVCPHPTIISSNEVNDNLGEADAGVMMQAWAEKLRDLPERCIQIDAFSSQIFTYFVFGSGNRLLPFFEDFIHSPMITRFAWSPLVDSALSANANILIPRQDFMHKINISDISQPINGLLAVHVRRGDFDEHCRRLSSWGSDIQGWFKHPELPDDFIIPAGVGEDPQRKEVKDYYSAHCWPTMEQIAARIADIRKTPEAAGLKGVYILTNGPREWVAELKGMIKGLGGWELVHSSRDLELTPEQKYIGQAIDMAVSTRAQVFIGNGFSSLSANVVLLRLSRNHSPRTNRIW